MITSEHPYRSGRAYERRCEINGLKAAAKVFVVYLLISYPFSQYVTAFWPLLVLAFGALNAMALAYVWASICTPWTAADDDEG